MTIFSHYLVSVLSRGSRKDGSSSRFPQGKYTFSNLKRLSGNVLERQRLRNGRILLSSVIMLLSLLLSSCAQTVASTQKSESTQTPASTNGQAATNVTVDSASPTGKSQFSPGITYIDNSLDPTDPQNDATAVNNTRALIKQTLSYQNTSIMAWGAPDPWPNPSDPGPSNWSYIDGRLLMIQQLDGIPVITLCEAPWWMKGQLQANGTTRLLTAGEEWSNIAYNSRILDNKMGDWLLLVQRVAERYMAPPYNVRYFQVWNEFNNKGYYNSATNDYDYNDSPGDPSGPNAKHGYTYMYNQVYGRLMQVAKSLHVATDSVKVGGPYAAIQTWSSTNEGKPSTFTKAYGIYDQRPLTAIQYWLQHKAGAGFITVDAGNGNDDSVNSVSPFTAAEKFADMVTWMRSLDNTHYPGAATLPIWWAEWYATSYAKTPDDDYNNAIKTYAMIKLIKAGGAVALSWGGLGDGMSDSGLWTPPAPQGGQPLPWYTSVKAFKDDFAPGTVLAKVTLSGAQNVDALASATHVLLVNKTDADATVSVNGGAIHSLKPYQVSVLSL